MKDQELVEKIAGMAMDGLIDWGNDIDRDAVEDIISLCRQHEWIPVSERLPDENTEVLVTQYKYMDETKGRYQMIAYRVDDDWMADDNDSVAESCFAPTHWMPLPEPPKEESDE